MIHDNKYKLGEKVHYDHFDGLISECVVKMVRTYHNASPTYILENNIAQFIAEECNMRKYQTGDLEIVESQDYLPEPTLRVNACSCGAKHTSNPRFHLNYCALK